MFFPHHTTSLAKPFGRGCSHPWACTLSPWKPRHVGGVGRGEGVGVGGADVSEPAVGYSTLTRVLELKQWQEEWAV